MYKVSFVGNVAWLGYNNRENAKTGMKTISDADRLKRGEKQGRNYNIK